VPQSTKHEGAAMIDATVYGFPEAAAGTGLSLT